MNKEEAIIRRSELKELYSQKDTPWTLETILLQRIALLDRVVSGALTDIPSVIMPVFDESLLEGYNWEGHTTGKVYKAYTKDGTKYRIVTHSEYPGQVTIRRIARGGSSWDGEEIYCAWKGREMIDWDEYNTFMELLTNKKLV